MGDCTAGLPTPLPHVESAGEQFVGCAWFVRSPLLNGVFGDCAFCDLIGGE
jgi:hypothetical protein